jgi:hypothetical protein
MNFIRAFFGALSLLAVLIFFRDLSGTPITISLCIAQIISAITLFICLFYSKE